MPKYLTIAASVLLFISQVDAKLDSQVTDLSEVKKLLKNKKVPTPKERLNFVS